MENKRLVEIPKSNQVLLELPTGMGKTINALRFLQEKRCYRPLIVLPKKVLEENWNAEIKKWNLEDTIKPIYIQYASFIKPQKWILEPYDSIIMEECHHISDRCFEVIKERANVITRVPICMLSATVTYEQKQLWKTVFTSLYIVRANVQDVINDNLLPTPTIAYVKMQLNAIQKVDYMKLQNTCNWWKRQVEADEKAGKESDKKKVYLYKCKVRNVWLAKQKDKLVKELYEIYSDYRSITFCADIDHCQRLGNGYDITSKNGDAVTKLAEFNNGVTNKVSACSILDEGVNVNNCQVGIFAYLTASNRLTVQRIGRILRHSKPIIYVLYYANTREEEIKELFEKRFEGASIPKYYTEDKIHEVYNQKMQAKS